MGTIYAVFGDELCVAKCTQVDRRDIDGEVFRVEVFPADKIALLSHDSVSLSRRLLKGNVDSELFGADKINDEQRYLLSIRAHRKFQAVGDLIHVDLSNYKELFNPEADIEAVDEELKRIFFKTFQKHPNLGITERSIFVSTLFTVQQIKNSIERLIKLGILIPSRTISESPEIFSHLPTYELSSEGFKELTKEKATVMDKNNRYFKTVEIPKIKNKKFSFVIMPFKQKEIDQAIYKQLIKPLFESKSGFMCIRSDEIHEPGPINDHIYSCIEKCEFVVAELSKANRNVDAELGMAIRANKKIYILTNKKLDKAFFDVRNFRRILYKDFTDLRQQLETLEL